MSRGLHLLVGGRSAIDFETAPVASAKWHRCSQRGAVHARNRLQPAEQRVKEQLSLFRLCILLVRQSDPHREQLARVSAEIEGIELEEAADHEAGAHQQHNRQGKFDNDHG